MPEAPVAGASEAQLAAAEATASIQAAAYQRYLEQRGARIAAYDELIAVHVAALQRYEADRASHAADVVAAEAKFKAEDLAQYEADRAAFRAAHDIARKNVDRMAFAGQVPVNVQGAKPGDYIVPEQDGDGIKGAAVTKPSFEQYQVAVGRVIAIEADGRARIIVKVA